MANDHPILLCHGISRFDFLTHLLTRSWSEQGAAEMPRWLDGMHYFRNIRNSLEAAGLGPVLHTNVPFAASVQERSVALGAQVMKIVRETGCEKVHLIAHSMGGLDARHMIVEHEAGQRVASLATIGTPHHGTPFADFGLKFGAEKWPGPLKKYAGVDFSGFVDLTSTACRSFSEDPRTSLAEATNGVRYTACHSQQTFAASLALFHFSWGVIHMAEEGGGPNDGLVPVSSQKWTGEIRAAVKRESGEVVASSKTVRQLALPFPADHLNQIGWWHPGDLMQSKTLGSIGTHARDLKRWNPSREFERQIQGFYLDLAQAARAL